MKESLFKTQKQLNFNQLDPAGIMFFAEAFTLAHQTLEEFCRQSPIGWNTWFNHPEWAAPLVHAEADFKAPMTADHKIEIQLILNEIGQSSVNLCTRFLVEQKVCAEVKTTHVFIDKKSKASRSIPDVILSCLRLA